MSNVFTSFLGAVSGTTSANMKDYQHADRLYVRDTYARAPKVGFLYFVDLEINPKVLATIKDNSRWSNIYYKNIGMLVKRIDLPRFSVETETINQYNRKTVVQKAIKYNNVTIDLHDDNSDITGNLWRYYYQYYYADFAKTTNIYGLGQKGTMSGFQDTKYGLLDYNYGLNNAQTESFFKSINIYVMHQQRFTQYTLVNPMITEWSHDTLEQSENAKILGNKMMLAYEAVEYNAGLIKKDDNIKKFKAYYDITPSPLSIGGKGSKTIFGPGGVISGASDVFSSFSEGNYLGAALQASQLVKNARQLTRQNIVAEATGVITNAVTGAAAVGNRNDVQSVNGIANLGIRSLDQAAPIVARSISLINK